MRVQIGSRVRPYVAGGRHLCVGGGCRGAESRGIGARPAAGLEGVEGVCVENPSPPSPRLQLTVPLLLLLLLGTPYTLPTPYTHPLQVVVPPGLTDAVLTEVLAPVSAAKWLHFTDVSAVFGGFAAPAHRAEYEAWLDRCVFGVLGVFGVWGLGCVWGLGATSGSGRDASSPRLHCTTQHPTHRQSVL